MTDPYFPDESVTPSADGQDAAAQTTEETALRRELEELRDKYLRLAAEYENFRKRSTRERDDSRHRAQGDLVLGLLDALDDLSRFAHLDPAVTDSKTVVDGAELVERKLLKSLAGHGLEVISPVDHPFDPALHEAVQTEPALSSEDDHMVGRVFQPGYMLNGRLLRPARVTVKQWRDNASPNE
ncbi:MAG: nucleotide exchange factor GrpE [Gemmatimonadaceae bacterium]